MPVEFLTDEVAARYGRYGKRLSRGAGGVAGLLAPAAAEGEPAAVALVRHVPGDPALGGARGGFWDFPDGGYCCPECGEPFTPLKDRWSGEQLDWQVFVRLVAHCRRRCRRAARMSPAGALGTTS